MVAVLIGFVMLIALAIVCVTPEEFDHNPDDPFDQMDIDEKVVDENNIVA